MTHSASPGDVMDERCRIGIANINNTMKTINVTNGKDSLAYWRRYEDDYRAKKQLKGVRISKIYVFTQADLEEVRDSIYALKENEGLVIKADYAQMEVHRLPENPNFLPEGVKMAEKQTDITPNLVVCDGQRRVVLLTFGELSVGDVTKHINGRMRHLADFAEREAEEADRKRRHEYELFLTKVENRIYQLDSDDEVKTIYGCKVKMLPFGEVKMHSTEEDVDDTTAEVCVDGRNFSDVRFAASFIADKLLNKEKAA